MHWVTVILQLLLCHCAILPLLLNSLSIIWLNLNSGFQNVTLCDVTIHLPPHVSIYLPLLLAGAIPVHLTEVRNHVSLCAVSARDLTEGLSGRYF